MRIKSLNSFTTNLPLVTLDNYNELIGSDTKSSIKSGIVNGVISEIDGVIDRYEHMFENIKIVLTGGTLNFAQENKNTIFADQNSFLKD